MNVLQTKKTTKNVRDIISDERALKRAARASIKDQKKVATKAAKLRAQMAR